MSTACTHIHLAVVAAAAALVAQRSFAVSPRKKEREEGVRGEGERCREREKQLFLSPLIRTSSRADARTQTYTGVSRDTLYFVLHEARRRRGTRAKEKIRERETTLRRISMHCEYTYKYRRWLARRRSSSSSNSSLDAKTVVARVPLIRRKYRVPLLLLLLLHTYNKSIYYMESRAVAIGGVRWTRTKKKVRQQRATRRDNRGGQSRGVHVRAYNYVYMCYIAYE
ncbi:unnamed protein product [Trichogramma brassicae]|uniref:Secreted protein n=1 Tax=Trichogramma brassicae TaxID=86971 RepID=A0A6H5J4F1_9HYME|nr:unnamed protein product [Trichogramma brassicae]